MTPDSYQELMALSTDEDDIECLNSVHGILSKLKSDVDRRFASISLKRGPMLVEC